MPVNVADERMRTTAERIHDELTARGIDVLLDDREERPGVKFKDADLVGCPLRITIGPRALERDAVELKRRTEKNATEVPDRRGRGAGRGDGRGGDRWVRLTAETPA